MNATLMATPDEEWKSDGLEILSIGTLYSGSWDKKYWSSSRGKDRYPYPVGYQALRTHKGLTYKMEIHEGSKGPIFQISSNDKQSASGETPDRAWETFQKKFCSRIKLWHGKRFSGKMDGVELFGFKNALVQRLLRELVASVNDASDHCSLLTNINEASAESHDMPHILSYKHSDLMPYLGKTRITGKRSRSSRGDNAGRCKPQHQGDNDPVLCATPKRSDNDEYTVSDASNNDLDISHAGRALPVFSDLEVETNVASLVDGMPVKSHEASDYSKGEPCLAQVQWELSSTGTCTSASLANFNSPQEEKPFDRQCVEVRGLGCQSATEEGNEKAEFIDDFPDSRHPVPKDSQVNYYGDLCAPDTLDTQPEITCPSVSGNHRKEHPPESNELLAAHLVVSEEPNTGSLSEEVSYNLNGNSERSDYDSVGEDIAKSMMTVLLPRAVPLLTYASRKKRRKSKLLKDSQSGLKLENESKGTIPSADVKSPAGLLSSSGMEDQIKTDVRSDYIDSAVSMLENVRCVPDSLDNDQCEVHVANQLLTLTKNAEVTATDLHKVKRGPDGIGSMVVIDATELSCCHSQTDGDKEIISHEEPPRDFYERPQEGGAHTLHALVDDCLNTVDGSNPVEICSKRTKFEDAPDCEGNKIIAGKLHTTPGSPSPKSSPVVVPSKYTAPLSESIVCRNIEDSHVSETEYAAGNLIAPDSFQVISADDGDRTKASFGFGGSLGEQMSPLQNEKTCEALAQKCSHSVLQSQGLSCTFNKVVKEDIDGSDLHIGKSQADICMDMIGNLNCESVNCSLDHGRGSFQNYASHVNQADICASRLANQEHSGDMKGTMKLIGCYSHPMRISSVMLTRKANEIYICVSCGLIEERKRNLFLYKLETKESNLGSPYMIGHATMDLPVLKDEFDREIAIDKSGLQLTPDARGLVLADSIRMPYCREKNLHCLCSNCESCCFEENAIKVVQIQLGYVSLVLRLNTIHRVHRLLVCEPQHLVALDESGRIYIWAMNPTWSVETEEYVIPSYDLLSSRIVELQRIPKSASLVVGHNGYGEFSLWDIINRSVVSRFSAPASSVIEFLPISLFSWQKKGLSHDKLVMEECLEKLVEATMLWFSRQGETNISCPTEGEDIAIWLFVCTSSDSRALSDCYSSSYHVNPDGCWRLGLLIRNILILGAALHPSTAAIGTSAGHGIIGTHKGHVYIWELATGTKLGTMHDFEGSGVSHIATDYSTSSTVAIAGDGGQLFVYLHA